MAAAAPVRPLALDAQGNRCPICQDHLMPDWRRDEVQSRMSCCGVLMCWLCWKNWDEKRVEVLRDFTEACGQEAFDMFWERHKKKLRRRARGENEKQQDQNKTKAAAGKKEDQKKRELEKELARHLSCPSCRAPFTGDEEGAVIQSRRMAEQGHSWAQCLMGQFYMQGKGVRKDMRQAERWYRAAMTDMSVMDGGPRAALNLGSMYEHGDGVRKDVEEAMKLWTMAHEAGHAKGTYNLGILFCRVEGSGPAAGALDKEHGVLLCRQAAEAGLGMAQRDLGWWYYKGKGVEQDVEKAKAWLAKAAKQGDAPAMSKLATALLETEGSAAMPATVALMVAAAEKSNATAKKLQCKEVLSAMEKHIILSQCASCGKPRAAMAEDPKRCNRCFAVAYCSPKCQKHHWKRGGHKVACNDRMKYLPEVE